MKLFSIVLLTASLVTLSSQAQEQEEAMELIERAPTALRLDEAEVRRMARDKSYPGGVDEESIAIQPLLLAPHPEKTIKQIQSEFFEE